VQTQLISGANPWAVNNQPTPTTMISTGTISDALLDGILLLVSREETRRSHLSCCRPGRERRTLLWQLLAVDRLDPFLRHADDDVAEAGTQVSRGDADRFEITLLVQ